jgi:hypothetical protein
VKRVALVLVLVGCGLGGADGGWEGTIEELPGGGVRVLNPAQGIWTEATAWRLVPERVIGEVEGPPSHVFSSIAGLEVGDDGRIYVLDRQASELRIFAPDGAHLRTVGRSGRGPGEYLNANGLGWLAPDSLVVIDQRGARYSVLDADGEYVRSVHRSLNFFGWTFQGRVADGRVWERTTTGGQADPTLVLVATPLRPAADAAAGAPRPDTVALPGRLFTGSFSVQGDQGGMTMAVPFAPGQAVHIDDGGHVWQAWTGEFRVARATMAGDTLLDVRLDAPPAPVTAADIDEWEAGPAAQRFLEMGGRIDRSRIPRERPVLSDLYVDPDGHLWVGVPGADGSAFALFGADGRYLGRVELPGFTRTVFLPPVVRHGRLHLAGADELGVERVHIFRIEPGPG